jgi:hypothetical protein
MSGARIGRSPWYGTLAVPAVLPGSIALREFSNAIAAGTAPASGIRAAMASAQSADEIAHLRLCRNHVLLVSRVMRRIPANREIDDPDVMAFVVTLREQISDYLADGDHHAGLSS